MLIGNLVSIVVGALASIIVSLCTRYTFFSHNNLTELLTRNHDVQTF